MCPVRLDANGVLASWPAEHDSGTRAGAGRYSGADDNWPGRNVGNDSPNGGTQEQQVPGPQSGPRIASAQAGTKSLSQSPEGACVREISACDTLQAQGILEVVRAS